MLDPDLDREAAVLLIRPRGRLREADFLQLASLIDPFIVENGCLRGLIIETASFPGWQDFPAMIAHLRFIREHHKAITRVALVTDSLVADIAQHLGSHFVSAQIRHFGFKELNAARDWVAAAPAPNCQ
jgi:hypothetical protein